MRLAWGHLATSTGLGVTHPGSPGAWAAFAAEIAMTFVLLSLILRFVDSPRLTAFTAAAASTLVALLVFVEGPKCGKLIHDGSYECRFLDCRYTAPERRLRGPHAKVSGREVI